MSLTTNLVAYWKLDNGALGTDAVGSNNLSNSGSVASDSGGKIGYGGDFGNDTTTRNLNIASTLGRTNNQSFSMSGWFKLRSQVDVVKDFYLMGHNETNTSSQINIEYDYNGGTPRLRVTKYDDPSHQVADYFYNITLTVGQWYHFVVTTDGSLCKLYVNGTYIGATSGFTANTQSGTYTNLFYVGGNAGRYNKYYADEIGFWGRELTSDEVSELYNSGNGLQYPFVSTINSTLTATKQDYTLTGQSVILKHAVKILPTYASFALTMQTVVARYGRTLIATFGSFALTGQAIMFRFGKGIQAAYGSFTLTGQNVAFKLRTSIVAQTGMFVLTGIAANLNVAIRYTWTMTASAGSFVLTGFQALFRIKGWLFDTKKTPNMTMETKQTNTWQIEDKN